MFKIFFELNIAFFITKFKGGLFISSLYKRIVDMTSYFDNQTISQTLGIPIEVIEGILYGRISEDVLEEYNPAKPPEIRIVEQKKFVRSLLVGIVSLGSSGGTTLTSSLATLTALRTTAPVAVVDLNEFSLLGSYLGIPFEKGKFYPNLIGWTLSEDLEESLITHPKISNLRILLGSYTLKSYLTIPINKMIAALDSLGQSNETVFIDCPKSPYLWPELFQKLDIICFVIQPEINSISAFWQAMTVIEPDPEKHFVVIRDEIGEGYFTFLECSRIIKDSTKLHVLGRLPKSNDIRKTANAEQNYILKSPKSDYALAVSNILEGLLPGVNQMPKKKKSIFKKILDRGD